MNRATTEHRRPKHFLSGPFGAGKTTAAVAHLRQLLQQERVRGDDILVLLPQRSLAAPYHAALYTDGIGVPPGAAVRVTTFASLAQQAVELYWPLLAHSAGFADSTREPTFLTLETSQYQMAPLVDAAIAQGAFEGVKVEKARIVSQILDNLNKAALHGLSIDQAYERLTLAVPGGDQRPARLNALSAAREVSHAFRQHCLQQTLLDFSLQILVFNEQLLTHPWSRTHLLRTHRHLIYDNAEEDTYSAHRLVSLWLPHLESAWILADTDAGYRTFLGADTAGVDTLRLLCDSVEEWTTTYVMSPAMARIEQQIDSIFDSRRRPPLPPTTPPPQPLVVPTQGLRFYPQMVQWAATQIDRLVNQEGVAAEEIAVLAPVVSDALRFSLQTALERCNVPLSTHRPSRALQDEPTARTLLTLARLAHPLWGMPPHPADVTLALASTIAGLDPVRASLLSTHVYPPRRTDNELADFAALPESVRQRVTYTLGEQYAQLHRWIYTYRASSEITPIDQFFARLFGEVLSQPGFGFHTDRTAAGVASQIVESARKFRWTQESSQQAGAAHTYNRDYVALAQSGALGALYLPGWKTPAAAVFLAPAYTFLLRNRAVDVQIWLDIGANSWWERLYQPLTHPYVLSPHWPAEKAWTERDEYASRQETLRRLLLGLLRRTRRQIYLATSDFSESGFEQRGPLLTITNQLLAANR
jgi:hypothetical protein